VNRARLRAARLAILLECAGVVPIIHGSTYREYCRSLEQQYCGLDIEVRRRARVEGRRRIRETGAEAAAIRLIPVPRPVCGIAKLSPRQRRRIRTAYRRKILRWQSETPPCSKCLIEAGMPKRSWPSRELAAEVRKRQNDPGLHVYPCPVQPGFWHIGHRR
jgi:hypothetical protein